MAKLHELLAAEKTVVAAWNSVKEDTLKKFKNPGHFFDGHSKALAMIEDTPENRAIEGQAREEKPVTTTVFETLQFALALFGRAEDLQWQKNKTDHRAVGTVMWAGKPLLESVPVDELLGLEARLTALRQVFADIPTLDATKHWVPAREYAMHVWSTRYPEETTKTEKKLIPVELSPATERHPAQVKDVTKDVVVGKFSMTRRSGAATALQKAEALKRIDELIIEVKKARMRANETDVVPEAISGILLPLLLEPLAVSTEDHQ